MFCFSVFCFCVLLSLLFWGFVLFLFFVLVWNFFLWLFSFNNQKNRNTAPPISKQGPKVELTLQTPQNMPIDTALPTRRTRLISLPPERLCKPLDGTFPPRDRHQKQEEVQSCSLKSGDHKHRQNEITEICYRKEKCETLQDQLNKEEIGNLPEKYQSNDSKDDARSWENKGTDRESTRNV